MYLYRKRRAGNARNRRDVADEIEIELVVEGGVDRVHESSHKERISVRGRVHDYIGADIAGSSWSVLDDELLTETLRQPLSYQACDDIETASAALDRPPPKRTVAGSAAR